MDPGFTMRNGILTSVDLLPANATRRAGSRSSIA
jgi:hypothetical protein